MTAKLRRASWPALLPFLLLFLTGCSTVPAERPTSEFQRWQSQAQRVTITRDDWGIAHVRGRSDADAVFGMIYAQAEDDFPRIESNYLVALGRLAEAEGEGAIWQDLRARMYNDADDLEARYAASPPWLRALMDAWADGLNFYLSRHPEVRPRVLHRFEPWMALSFTEGSIGGDIERIDLDGLRAFYEGRPDLIRAAPRLDAERSGSNGIAIAPERTRDGHALLLINPHTSFFFRAETQMTSEEGLNAYGAATWGQFFIYQGFNDSAGWMHSSSGVDVVDEYRETIVRRGSQIFYRHGDQERPVTRSTTVIRLRDGDGAMGERRFDIMQTHHGPVIRRDGENWITIALMHRPVEALSQSFLRTKARDFSQYLTVMNLKANSSNNTVYADRHGTIAYLHPQFVPRRNDRFDFTRTVDGSDPATDWQGLHELDELPSLHNPPNHWLQNTNNWPYSVAGSASPRREGYPRYMDTAGENPRGLHAVALLDGRRHHSLETLQADAYSTRLPAFDMLLPGLLRSWRALSLRERARSNLAEPIAMLERWDRRWSTASIPTSLAVFWGEELLRRVGPWSPGLASYEAMAALPAADQIDALRDAVARLEREHGDWRTPWGEINRFQRLTGELVQRFDDQAPSIAVGFPSARWGTLASFGARPYGTRRWYGTSGNSFVAVVEFGPRVRARAVTAGGQSGDPASPHFVDQSVRYASGDLRSVYFHPDELAGHVERSYRPGQ